MWNRVALFQPFSKIETNIQTSTFNPNRNLAKIQSTNDNAEKRRKSALSTSVWQNAQEQGKLLRSGPHSELSERTCYLLDSDRVACIQSRVPYTNTANDAGLHRHRFVERYFAPCLVPRNIRGYVRDDFSSFDRKRPLACSARTTIYGCCTCTFPSFLFPPRFSSPPCFDTRSFVLVDLFDDRRRRVSQYRWVTAARGDRWPASFPSFLSVFATGTFPNRAGNFHEDLTVVIKHRHLEICPGYFD